MIVLVLFRYIISKECYRKEWSAAKQRPWSSGGAGLYFCLISILTLSLKLAIVPLVVVPVTE